MAGPVAEFLGDGQGGLVALFGGVVVAAELGEHPELVVAAGEAGPVAEFLDDGQGGLVALFGGVVVAAGLGEVPELSGSWRPGRPGRRVPR